MVLSGSDNRYILTSLSPSTEYEVMLTAVFKDESESDTVSVIETTSKQHYTDYLIGNMYGCCVTNSGSCVFALSNHANHTNHTKLNTSQNLKTFQR